MKIERTERVDFIDEARLKSLLAGRPPEADRVREVIAKSLAKQPLSVEETAVLLAADEPELVEEIFAAARALKREVYGNRVVLFAPLYIGNRCINDCTYCSFRRSNADVKRRTLDDGQLAAQVRALEDAGHKRLILVFGEHPHYDADYIARTVEKVYATRSGSGEIRRININAAPLDHDGYRKVKEAGIGTYQIFQETYDRAAYARCHPSGTPKSDYLWRLHGPGRAIEAGLDDVGIGALFGLADWRFEVLALVAHAVHLQRTCGVGPHTISFPRLRPADGVDLPDGNLVDDHDFQRLVAVLRLAVPYTGLICTAREKAELRRKMLSFGVSQIDGGSRIDLGGYATDTGSAAPGASQFSLGDMRSLDEVIGELLREGYLPSFCTACYRLGRTGEHFMEFAVPGFIKRYCTPNALATLAEYVEDYASEETRASAEEAIAGELEGIEDERIRRELARRLLKIRNEGDRDLYF